MIPEVPGVAEKTWKARTSWLKTLLARLADPKGHKTKNQKAILAEHPELVELFRKFPYPAIKKHTTFELLSFLFPDKKIAIRDAAKELNRLWEKRDSTGLVLAAFGIIPRDLVLREVKTQ